MRARARARAEGEKRSGQSTLVDFLKSRRWFGEKGHDILDARVRDVIPVSWPNTKKKFAVVRVDVRTAEGTSRYQLFSPRAENGEPQTSIDALEDPVFRRGLADAWVTGASFESGRSRWIIESAARAPHIPSKARVTLSRGEQTNSSVIMGQEAILKLFRRLEPGPHPDVEVTRFLTIDRQFMHVPVLLGTIRFEDRDGRTMAGMLQEFVPKAIDGWTYARDRLRGDLGIGRKKTSPAFEADAAELGSVVREMHECLASGDAGSDFDLRPATQGDVLRWEQAATETVRRASSALERAVKSRMLRGDAASAAREVVNLLPRVRARIGEFAEGIANDAGANTRTHGDLHLGQVLRSTTGEFLVIDFEGEPTRPLEQRRARSSPLRDVAGVLRSFAYASAVGSGKARGSADRAREWEAQARAAFLRGYFSQSGGRAGLLPRGRANADRLIALFECEKVFYELAYELAHRPDWAWVPLRDIARLAP